MKYILTEKFILNEKLILNENEIYDKEIFNNLPDTIKRLTSIKELFSTPIESLDNNSTTAKELDDLVDSINLVSDTIEVKKNAQEYLEKIYSIYGKSTLSLPQYSTIKADIDALKGIFNSDQNISTSRQLTNIRQYISRINNELQSLSLTTSKTDSSNLKSAINSIDATIELITSILDNSKTSEILASNKEALQLKTQLKTLSDVITKKVTIKDSQNIKEACDTFNNSSIIPIINNRIDTAAEDKQKESDKLAQSKEMQHELENNKWAEKLKAAKSTEERNQVWDEYYQSWGKDGEILKQLNPAFEQQLLHFGFSKLVNPFLDFVIKNVLNGPKLSMSTDAYGGLNNAYVDDIIDDNDLKNPDLILICNDLYKHKGFEIIQYLNERKHIITQFNSKTDKISVSLEAALFNIFSTGVYDINQAGAKDSITTLKSIEDIRTMSRAIFGVAKEIKLDLSDGWVSGHIKTEDDAKLAIISLVNMYENLFDSAIEPWKMIKQDYNITEDYIDQHYSIIRDKFKKEWKKLDINSSNILAKIKQIAKSQNLGKGVEKSH